MTAFICRILPLVSLLIFGAGTDAAYALGCQFSGTGIAFGSVNTLTSGSSNGTANLNIYSCHATVTTLNGTISAGNGSGGSNGTFRQMKNGTSSLNFQLYSDSARTNVFGSATGNMGGAPITFKRNLSGPGESMTIPVYGRIIGNQSSVPPGSYTSTVMMSVRYRSCSGCVWRDETFEFNVTATVEKGCSVSATDIDFGSQGGLASAVDANGRLNVLCTPGTDFQISLNNGQNGTAANDRKMRSAAGGTVRYNLYRDPGHTALWGSTLSTDTLMSTGKGTTDTHTVYGQVPVQSTPPAGVYTDTIIVTLTY
ncbi:MAG: spore coat U domain-containing protein [Rhodobacterales bacterium]|nr:spore coat U domain-containing protein [Rhodobacterales bacterium]